jgi:SAM-dependent methyltransferase
MKSTNRLPRALGLICVAATLQALSGCASTYGDDLFRPPVGLHGKDVMWVPTLDYAVLAMLDKAKVTADDLVIDLGSGDGRIPIEAARRYGARAVGIEYNADLAALAKRDAARAGVTDRVTLIHGDIFKEDFSAATVLTLYLGRDLNLRLKPTILKMAPGTRVVSNTFDMGLWGPDEVIRHPSHNTIHYWVVPARVEGEWRVTGLPGVGNGIVRLRQRFQRLDGELIGDKPSTLVGRLEGRRMILARSDSPDTPLLDAEVMERGFTGRTADGQPVTGKMLR